MNFLTLDLSAASTGYALIQELGEGKPPRVECGSWNCRGRDIDEMCAVLSDHLVKLLRGLAARGVKVDRAAIEDVIRRLPVKKVRKDNGLFAATEVEQLVSNPHTMTVLPALVGAACAILHQFKIQIRLVPVATWRKGFIGTARAPVHIAKDKTSKWLKAEVRTKAEMLAVEWGFTIRNYDMSDAFGIACWLAAQEGSPLAVRALRRAA